MLHTPAPDPPRERPLFAAPHRPMFLSGGVMLLISFALWAAELAARAGLIPAISWSFLTGWLHALMVVSGIFPFFIFGFLLTAMPRWQGAEEASRPVWLRAWQLLVVGWVLIFMGAWWWLPLTIVGLLVVISGWLILLSALWRIAHAPRQDRIHARVATWGLIGSVLALIAWVVGLAWGDPRWIRGAINLSVWAGLIPVFVSVCHRMIPFFSSNIIVGYEMLRPRWVLGVIIGASVLHGLSSFLGRPELGWVLLLPASAVSLWLTVRWRLIASLKVPLLGMLHVGFAWLGIGLGLAGLQSAGAMLGQYGLGLAPLHVIGIGFFGSILLAMVSRVTLGHSGRPLQADRLTWGLFLGLQIVVCLRVAAELVPWEMSGAVMLASGLGWFVIFLAWSIRYLPIYWRPRRDGKPG